MANFLKKITFKNIAKAIGLKGIKPMLQSDVSLLDTIVPGATVAAKTVLYPKVAPPIEDNTVVPEDVDIAGVGKDIIPLVPPTIDAAEVERARRRALIAAQQRGGRASTILTRPY